MTDSTKAVLVTGGSSGIGLATARRFLEDGYRVAICSRSQERLDKAAAELADAGDVGIHAADLAVPADAATVVARTVSDFGRLDVLVNAHGVIGTPRPLEEVTTDEWQFVLGTNLMGPILTTAAAVPHLRETGGNVVNVVSINAIQAEPQMAPYGVSKAGLAGFTKYAAVELAETGVRVNAVLPGWVRTPMAVPFFAEAGVLDRPMSTNVMGRAAEPSEIAAVIAFLAGDGASFMTGECLVADGGHWVQMAPLAPRP